MEILKKLLNVILYLSLFATIICTFLNLYLLGGIMAIVTLILLMLYGIVEIAIYMKIEKEMEEHLLEKDLL